jgi:parvulin-like peptidyl-prolyl isomerase
MTAPLPRLFAATLSLCALVAAGTTAAPAAHAQAAKPAPRTGGATPAQKPPAAKPAAKPGQAAIPAAAPAVKLAPNVVAQVNGQNITADDVLTTVQSFAGRPVLQNLIQAKVIAQEAKRLGVSVTPAEVAAEIKKQKEQAVESNKLNTGTMMTWSQIAAREGISEGFIEWSIRNSLLARKTFTRSLAGSVPTLGNQVKLAHILIPTIDMAAQPDAKPPTPDEEKQRDADALKKATDILADIQAKKITFEDAAKQFSADRGPNNSGSAPAGGALPYAPRGAFDPAFEEAGWKLAKPGDITPAPIKSRFGYHLIKLVQRGKDAPAAEKAAYKKEQIDQQLQNAGALNAYIGGLMQQAKVNYNLTPKIAPAAKAPTRP